MSSRPLQVLAAQRAALIDPGRARASLALAEYYQETDMTLLGQELASYRIALAGFGSPPLLRAP